MSAFIKVTLLKERGIEEPTLINLDEIHSFIKTDVGIMLMYKDKDPEDGEHWTDYVKEGAGEISRALDLSGVKVISI